MLVDRFKLMAMLTFKMLNSNTLRPKLPSLKVLVSKSKVESMWPLWGKVDQENQPSRNLLNTITESKVEVFSLARRTQSNSISNL